MIIGKVFTVTEVNRIMKRIVNDNEEFANLQVEGEISNFKRYPSGHCYFNLKDKQGSLKAVMFARAAVRLKALPEKWFRINIKNFRKTVKHRPTWQCAFFVPFIIIQLSII